MQTGPWYRSLKYVGVVGLMLVLMLAIQACAPAAPAPTAEEPTEAAAEPAATEAPAEEPAAEEAAAEETDPMMTVFGEMLPEGAVPYDQQISREACSNTANQTTFDFMVAVYQRYCAGDSAFSLALVDLDKDFNVIPMAAESWSVAEDNVTWTFNLRPGMIWR